MPIAGVVSRLSLPGTAVAFTAQALVDMGDGKSWQIVDPIRRILNPAVAVTVKVNAVAQGATTYTVDPLLGIVTFAAVKVAPVTIDASYLPLLELAECKSATASCAVDLQDVTKFNRTSKAKAKFPTLGQATGTVGRLTPSTAALAEDMDPGAGTVRLWDLYTARTITLLDLDLGDGTAFRAWVHLSGLENASSVEALAEGTFTWESTVRRMTGRTDDVSYTWGAVA